MKRSLATFLLVLAVPACTDDRVTLRRGPLGPASYLVEVTAEGEAAELSEHREATLEIQPRPNGAAFVLKTGDAQPLIEAELRLADDGSLFLEAVRGVSVGASGETDLASLVGQLHPPLPERPVRIGDRWASTQRISTETLQARITTELRLVRYRRLAGSDSAELQGEISGELTTSGEGGTFEGKLEGTTDIAWSIHAARVAAADTDLLWTLANGDKVTLETRVSPD